jgi:DNA-binding NarL/FixJ family response regulator
MATERPAKSKRILVVEDEPMIRMLLEDMLGELGYTVTAEAAGIEEALEATKNADFDLAILAPISTASPPCRLPKPSLPAARRSFLRRAMARCPSPIGAGRC